MNKYSLLKFGFTWIIGLTTLVGAQHLVAALPVAAPEMAESDKNIILIKDVRMPRVPPVSRTAAIYLVIENTGKQDVYLTNVITQAAHHAMIHKTETHDGVASMGHIGRLHIAPQSRIEFSPGGYHIMLMGLDSKTLEKPFTVTFEFDGVSPQTFTVEY